MSAVILKRGDSGPAVKEVRDRLVQLGLLKLNPSAQEDYFDDELFSAVQIFQQNRGLNVDGIVGPRTMRRLDEARWKLGDRVLSYSPSHLIHGEDVAQLQQKLGQLGFDLDRIDGIFGTDTYRVVREFQSNVGLISDGICGPEVFRALARLDRTVSGGSQEHLRELTSWDSFGRTRTLETATIVIEPSAKSDLLLYQDISIANVCFDIASRLEGRLLTHGTLVLLTRAKLGNAQGERASAAFSNNQNADLVISISMDSYKNDRAHGIASYYFGHEFSRSATGLQLAELIQEEITGHTSLKDNQVHAKTWDLLRLTSMPSVRTEIGYATNPQDAAILGNPAMRDVIAGLLESAISRIFTPRIG